MKCAVAAAIGKITGLLILRNTLILSARN